MNKGIIIGAEHESGVGATLPFVTFRHATSVRQQPVLSRSTPLTEDIVTSIFTSHPTLSPGSRPSGRGGFLCVALPTPRFLRTRSRDSPPHSC
jgi:hypothetical protein